MASASKHNNSLNCEPRWIRSHRRNFLNHISQQGYSIYTCWLYRRAVTLFCAERFSRNLRKADLRNIRIKSLIEEVLQHLPKSIRSHARFSLGRFIEHLAQAGAIKLRQPPPKILTDRERLEDEYISYLRHQRGMSQSTIDHCRNYMRYFLSFQFGEALGDLNAITPEAIIKFLCRARAKSELTRSVPSLLRNLFNFLFWSGKTRRNSGDQYSTHF